MVEKLLLALAITAGFFAATALLALYSYFWHWLSDGKFWGFACMMFSIVFPIVLGLLYVPR